MKLPKQKQHKPIAPRTKLLIPAASFSTNTAAYIREFDRLNQLKSMPYRGM